MVSRFLSENIPIEPDAGNADEGKRILEAVFYKTASFFCYRALTPTGSIHYSYEPQHYWFIRCVFDCCDISWAYCLLSIAIAFCPLPTATVPFGYYKFIIDD